MKRVLHNIAHTLGWYSGRVETWWEEDKLMVGFRCKTCGRVEGIHEVPEHIFSEAGLDKHYGNI